MYITVNLLYHYNIAFIIKNYLYIHDMYFHIIISTCISFVVHMTENKITFRIKVILHDNSLQSLFHTNFILYIHENFEKLDINITI
ncbi:hypothetical protein D3C87_983350 [compost metagenome]